MPRELEFKILFDSKVDSEAEARRTDIELKNGKRTVNEARADDGLPLLDTPQADMPMLYSGSSVFFLSPDGIIDAMTASGASAATAPDESSSSDSITVGNQDETETNAPVKEVKNESQLNDKSTEEVKKFLRWIRKGNFKRKFNFEVIEADYAEVLNKYVGIGDLESARWYAERYIGL